MAHIVRSRLAAGLRSIASTLHRYSTPPESQGKDSEAARDWILPLVLVDPYDAPFYVFSIFNATYAPTATSFVRQ